MKLNVSSSNAEITGYIPENMQLIIVDDGKIILTDGVGGNLYSCNIIDLTAFTYISTGAYVLYYESGWIYANIDNSFYKISFSGTHVLLDTQRYDICVNGADDQHLYLQQLYRNAATMNETDSDDSVFSGDVYSLDKDNNIEKVLSLNTCEFYIITVTKKHIIAKQIPKNENKSYIIIIDIDDLSWKFIE